VVKDFYLCLRSIKKTEKGVGKDRNKMRSNNKIEEEKIKEERIKE